MRISRRADVRRSFVSPGQRRGSTKLHLNVKIDGVSAEGSVAKKWRC